MRCGTDLIQTGDTTYEVRKSCGEPDDARQRVEVRTSRRRVRYSCGKEGKSCDRIRGRSVEIVIDEWTYDQGSTKFIKYLVFEQGRLVSVTTGKRGSS